jgi:anthranilate phosphoribosyltransferase
MGHSSLVRSRSAVPSSRSSISSRGVHHGTTRTPRASYPGYGRSNTFSEMRCRATSLTAVIEQLCEGKDLSEEQAKATLYDLVQNAQCPEQMAAFIVLLRAKGETAEEIAGLAMAMEELSVKVDTPYDVLDIVGTGGDGIGSVNISTGATVIAAAAGARVAKHGSRSVSSLCGSGDVVEAFGVELELGPKGIAKCIEEVGLGFMFAPAFHPAMKVVRPVRKSLGVRTAFNMLGPLLNPAHAKYALIGVYSTDISRLMAHAALRTGIEKTLVVHSMGLDELTPMGPASIVEASSAGVTEYEIDPLDFGISRCDVKDLAGGDAALNARILKDVFGGERNPVADALNLNAGVALAAAKVAGDVKEGISMAQDAQRSGKAADTLRKWIEVSRAAKSLDS